MFFVNFGFLFIDRFLMEWIWVVVWFGFEVVECYFLYDILVVDVYVCFEEIGLKMFGLNMVLGDFVVGDFGFVVLLGCVVEVWVVIDQVVVYGN